MCVFLSAQHANEQSKVRVYAAPHNMKSQHTHNAPLSASITSVTSASCCRRIDCQARVVARATRGSRWLTSPVVSCASAWYTCAWREHVVHNTRRTMRNIAVVGTT